MTKLICTKCKKECKQEDAVGFYYDDGRFLVFGYYLWVDYDGRSRGVFCLKCRDKIYKYAGLIR